MNGPEMTRESLAGRVDELLGQLTLEEKAALTVGRDVWTTVPVPRLGIPSIWMSDGPTGLRKATEGFHSGMQNSVPATCFPTESALAASWNPALVRQVASAIGREAQANDVQIVLGPGVNLKRSPLGGRSFEYFSEDPLLSGTLAAAFVEGLRAEQVGASVKHFVANEQETGRMYTDSVVDERALRELYLRPFEIAVTQSQPMTIMPAYNLLNGTYCAENATLMRQIARDEWGFRGVFVSDWNAVNDRVAGIEAGLDLQMPAAPTAESVVAAVREGRLAEARLDEIVRHVLTMVLTAHASRRPGVTADLDAHHRLARQAAAECVTLLKNSGAVLPLAGDALSEIAVIGRFAREPRYQGSGSSRVNPARPVENLYDELSALVGSDGHVNYTPGYDDADETTPELLLQAQQAAARARVAVVVVGLPDSYESEGGDRAHLDLPPAHNALIEAVAGVQPRTVVVLLNGSAVAMPWARRVPTILEGWLGGQAGGGALADVLLGRGDGPSGKLAETFPARLEDTPAYLDFPGDGAGDVRFSEGLYTGYRWYDARNIEPLFPFGHGLSYTTFEFVGLTVDPTEFTDEQTVNVHLRVRNTGDRAGAEVVQLYVHQRAPRLQRPERELKAFTKVGLEPGEERGVDFTLDWRAFALYDPRVQEWVTDPGTFDLLIGASSRDIRLRQSVTLTASRSAPAPLTRLTPMRTWATIPAARAALLPIFNMVATVGAAEGRKPAAESSSGEAAEGADAAGFLKETPIAKLVVMGMLSEQDLTRLLAEVNGSAARSR